MRMSVETCTMDSCSCREKDGYEEYLHAIQSTFAESIANDEPLFTTDAGDLFEVFISNMPGYARQHYNCNACRHFINRFGGLVTIDARGRTKSAIWTLDVPGVFMNAVEAVHNHVMKSKVTGVFLSDKSALGFPETNGWSHMHVVLPTDRVYNHRLHAVNEAIAEKKADFQILIAGLVEYPIEAVKQATTILESESLSRSERFVDIAVWLRDLHIARNGVKNSIHKTNLVWRAVATAPIGWAHVKNTMIGTLLDDIVSGMSFDQAKSRFETKVHPLAYQRPQAAPSAGNIEKAEKIVEKLGIRESLKRRFARLEELNLLWSPRSIETKQDGSGVFSHLAPKGKTNVPAYEMPAKTMTWTKFSETILPSALSIELDVRPVDNYSAILTASDPEAPCILQWNNNFSWYVYHNGSGCGAWNLSSGYTKVTGICLQPSMWQEGYDYQGKSIFFILEGAKDTRIVRNGGNSLFPEILKAELREVRSTIEAYSKDAKLEGYEEASACGLRLQAGSTGSDWNARIRVTTSDGVFNYVLDRWD